MWLEVTEELGDAFAINADGIHGRMLARFFPWGVRRVFLGFGLVWFEAYRPGKQFFSHVGTEPPLPGFYHFFFFFFLFFFWGGGGGG